MGTKRFSSAFRAMVRIMPGIAVRTHTEVLRANARRPDPHRTCATSPRRGQHQWANTDDRAARTAKARAASPASLAYWERDIDRQFPGLDPTERRRRAESLWKAHQARMALKASKARRAKAVARRAKAAARKGAS